MSLKAKVRVPQTGNEIILQYFKCIEDKDLEGALELFDYDAVIFEPFSNVRDGLRGKSAIEPFLKVAMMANSNFKREIKIKAAGKTDRLTALVTFERGDKIDGKFAFEFSDGSGDGKKIKSLHIKFP